MVSKLRMIHHHPKHDRRRHRPCCPLGLYELDSVERREGRHNHAFPATEQRGQEVRVNGGVVIQRRHAQIDVTFVKPLGCDHNVLGTAERIDVHGHRALGHAGCAGSEGDRTQVPFIDRLARRRFGAGVGQHRISKRSRQHLLAGREHGLHTFKTGSHQLELGVPYVRRDDESLGADLVDLRRQPLRGEPEIDRHRDTAELDDREIANDVFRASCHEQAETVAFFEAKVMLKPRGDAIDLCSDVTPGHPLAAGIENISFAIGPARNIGSKTLRNIARSIAISPNLCAFPPDGTPDRRLDLGDLFGKLRINVAPRLACALCRPLNLPSSHVPSSLIGSVVRPARAISIAGPENQTSVSLSIDLDGTELVR